MTKKKQPIAIRAAMRGVLAFGLVIAVYAVLRITGVEVSTEPQAMVIVAAVGGAVWAGFYAMSASAVEKMIAKTTAKAEAEKE